MIPPKSSPMIKLKKIVLPVILLLSLPFFSGKAQQTNTVEDEYAHEWLKIDALVEKGLPQSALEELDLLQPLAKSRNHQDQYIKCILYRIKLQADFEESSLENNIYIVEQEIAGSKAPVKQILHSILARLYWNYFLNNRFQLMDRLPGQRFDPNAIQTWDLHQLVNTTISNFRQSLKDPRLLRSIDLKEYDVLLEKGSKSKIYRPSLYDFLAHEAIDFFMQEETYLTRPVDFFNLNNISYFSDSEDFSKLKLQTADSLSLRFYALKLLQDVVVMHLKDQNPAPLIDVELKRLGFVHAQAVVDQKDSLYRAALEKLIQRYKTFPSVTDIMAELAESYYSQGFSYTNGQQGESTDFRVADSLCTAALALFPESDGANNCKVIQHNIRMRFLNLKTEFGNLPGKPVLASVNYRNIGEIYGRIVRVDPEQHRLNTMTMDNRKLIDYFMAEPAVRTFHYNLTKETDFQQHTTELALPSLEPGFYVIVSASSSQFHTVQDVFAWTPLWVSQISYINKINADGSIELYMLDRESGQPLKNVSVKTYLYEYEYASRTRVSKLWNTWTTDKNGYLLIPAPAERKDSKVLMFRFEYKNDVLIPDFPVYLTYQGPQTPVKRTRTHLFTDRAIYRPGQTVYFKGISYDALGKTYTLLRDYETTVYLYDVNGRIIENKRLKSNEFGSFSGSFILPYGTLTGSMRISCDYGTQSIQVEEYKRPRFEVVFDPVKEHYKTGEKVDVTVKALSFSGSPVDQAEVRYRITRQPEYPFWYDFRYMLPASSEAEITNGSGKTNASGELQISFRALADPAIPKERNAVYTYTVYADVVDINGESHSREFSVKAGNLALLLETNLGNQVFRDQLKTLQISATNLNQQAVKASGILRIQKLKTPPVTLRPRLWERPDRFVLAEESFKKQFPNHIYRNEGDTASWEKDGKPFTQAFDLSRDSVVTLTDAERWKPGVYELTLESRDAFGSPVIKRSFFLLTDSENGRALAGNYLYHALRNSNAEPGTTAGLLVGSCASKARVLVEFSKDNQLIHREWLSISNRQQWIDIPILESYRGNLDYCLTLVKDNQHFQQNGKLLIPYTNKELKLEFTRFRSKLKPGEQDQIEVKVTGSKAGTVEAEALFCMYDASLETFVPHQWDFQLYSPSRSYIPWQKPRIFQVNSGYPWSKPSDFQGSYQFREYDRLNWMGYAISEFAGQGAFMKGGMDGASFRDNPSVRTKDIKSMQLDDMNFAPEQSPGSPPSGKPDPAQQLSGMRIRKSFQETAFFFPALRTNAQGEIVFSYTVPEALTRWNLLGLVHTPGLEYSLVKKEIQTLQDLMIYPNLPRFFREGDTCRISVKIVNQNKQTAEGSAVLRILDAATQQDITASLLSSGPTSAFRCQAGQSAYAEWTLVIPEGIPAVVIHTAATSGNLTDAEENLIPVLSGRTLVTESLPLAMSGPGTRTFTFNSLLKQKSTSLRHHRLSLEFSSQPAWYAVQALPSLMDFDPDAAEEVYNSLYATSLAFEIVDAHPQIRSVFEQWKKFSPSSLLSALEKNPDLKTLSLNETPWVADANQESESKQRIGELFDVNILQTSMNRALQKLMQLQGPNGGWPWYSGLPESRYITTLILTGIGKLRTMGITRLESGEESLGMMARACTWLDQEATEEYRRLFDKDGKLIQEKNVTPEQIQYLYARSFFTDIFGMDDSTGVIATYYLNQQAKYWNSFNPYLQAMMAFSMKRYGKENIAKDILASLKQKSLYSEEMGMYWRDIQRNPTWWTSPVQAQALLIELFDEAGDAVSVERMKRWLLKQKQSRKWESRPATADACYALLNTGEDWLETGENTQVIINNQVLNPAEMPETKAEAGTGYFRTSWNKTEILPGMGTVTLQKTSSGPSWGAMYWQYFEEMKKVAASQGPLSVKKKYFIRRNTDAGPVLEELNRETRIKSGDRVVVRLEIRTDRDLDFVHLKDPRISGFEPEETVSGYRWQQGLSYYQSIRDASNDYFFPVLLKGTYIFDYTLLASLKGDYSAGPAVIQCYYAPEFTANSDGTRIKIR